jgi:hypothetical protein
MSDADAKLIFDYSNGRKTSVSMDGRAAPVECEPHQQCTGKGAMIEAPATPGMEGVLT